MAAIRAFLRPAYLISFLCGAVLFGAAGWFLAQDVFPKNNDGKVLFESSNRNYTYIDPLLACDVGTEDSFTDLKPLKEKLTSLINKSNSDGSTQTVSVYFRSLKGAHWFDINPTTTYAPASLLKTFVLLAYLKEVDDENNPALLQKQITFQASSDMVDNPGEIIPHLTAGHSYSVNQVITQLIQYSDNDALATLTANMDQQGIMSLNEIFTDLQITPLTQSNENAYRMPVDQYAMIFRVLYGSTYLSRQYSEMALGLLSKAHYSGGIVSGVPAGTVVAHKFGVSNQPGDQELHDCGIVYYPSHPYLLCVMTRGTDFQKLQETIKAISAAAYQDQQRRHPQSA